VTGPDGPSNPPWSPIGAYLAVGSFEELLARFLDGESDVRDREFDQRNV